MKKMLLLIAGWLFMAVGAVGAFLPVLPTTPFLLLAAGCFSFASPRLYAFLSRSRFFGSYIENYRTKQGVPVSAKVRGITALWAVLIVSGVHMRNPWMLALFGVVGVSVTIHLLSLKTKKPDPPGAEAGADSARMTPAEKPAKAFRRG